MSDAERLIHMIGNAHIDPVWLWQWPEGYQEVRATFASALERMDERPDFIFTHTSVLFLKWVEESDPEMFARIRERVEEGRWQVVGGWWIEPDCNVPSGESFVRQGLYGQRYLLDRFGTTATTGANLDSFGHNPSLPQILRRSGMDSYVFLRPKPEENAALPGPLFRWEAPDGSRVLAYRIPHEYCAPRDDLGDHVSKSLATLPREFDELAIFYGVGNHGGGPTRRNLRSIDELSGDNDVRLELSSLRRFFDAVGDNDLPAWRGELQHHAPGCYTTHSGIKRWNRRAEALLQRAEKWSVVADALRAQKYPLRELSEAWQLVLFNQFHDTLAGTSIEPAYEDARDQIGHAISVAALAFNRAVQSIARQIDIPFEERAHPLVVFNPHPWWLRADVELEYNWLTADGVRLLDATGETVPLQLTRSLTTMGDDRARLVFTADVPPLGYRVYRIVPGMGESTAIVSATETTLENAHLLLEIDPASGHIARLVHRATGTDLAAPGRAHACVVEDTSDTWGHDVVAFDDVIGEFACTSVRLLERGSVRAVLRVESAYGASRLREDYILSADASHVDIVVTLDWQERLKLLKLRYPTSIESPRATYEVPYGHLERETGGHEEPGQSWIDVSGGGCGLTVINDAKSGYDVRGADPGISAVRSPVWAWHDPRQLERDGDFEYMDQGRQRFRVRLVPHAGDWRQAEVPRLAAELNQPPHAMFESFHPGPLPALRSFADDGGGSFVVTVVKGAEDGDGYVLRGYETAGESSAVTVTLLDLPISVDVDPHEIATIRVPADPGARVRKTNLLEQ
jgi:alpha-mannosidase